MKISYWPYSDVLFVKFRSGAEVRGEEVGAGVAVHRDIDGEVLTVEVGPPASRLVDVGLLDMRGFVANYARLLAGETSPLEGAATRDRRVAGGEPLFRGTDVPVREFVESLKSGGSIGDFIGRRDTPVSREQVVAFLDWAVGAASETADEGPLP